MGKINVLDKHIAQLIAAGEVVERPASVIKELVENSIDAKASTITVEIKNGGVSYIRITDNGIGIDKDDVKNAFVNHATSKIFSADDLNEIFTLGFRGEALASIAAVSKVEIFTKTQSENYGTHFACHAGEQVEFEQAGCPNGTMIVVRDLFYNTPARMKFLKRDVSEANAVADVIDKLVLSHPEISFRFIREGKQVLLTAGDSKLISSIYSVFSRDIASNLIEVNYTMNGITVTGFISKPVNCRASRAMQYIYLNNRYIKSQSCIMAMENAYKGMMMVGKFPVCVLNLDVPTNTVDINVHPAKTQVRFSDEKRVTSTVYYAVKTALESFDVPAQVDLAKLQKLTQKSQEQAVQIQMQNQVVPQKSAHSSASTPNVAKTNPNPDFWQNTSSAKFENSISNLHFSTAKTEHKPIDYDEIDLVNNNSTLKKPQSSIDIEYDIKDEINQNQTTPNLQSNIISNESAVDDAAKKDVIFTVQDQAPRLRIIGEAFKTYIICEQGNKLYLIDKHAAHERIIYNELKKQAKMGVSSQILLSPITISLAKNEYNIVIENIDSFEKAGFKVDDFGFGAVIVREIPSLITYDDVQETVCEIAEYLSANQTVIETEKIDNMYHMSACKAAIKAGNNNSMSELEYLANQVLNDHDVRYCPHGRPVLIEMTRYELEKQFGRIQ